MSRRAERVPAHGASIDQWVLRVAGTFVLLAVALAWLHSANWLWLAAFVGANMLQASFTGFCPLAMVLRRLGVAPGAAFCAGTPDGAQAAVERR
jgi:hypothetical protein